MLNVFTGAAVAPSPDGETERPVTEVEVTVLFRRTARASVSAGVLLSTQNRVQYRTEARRTGSDPSGLSTTVTVVRTANDAPVQAIPFSFLDVRAWSLTRGASDVAVTASAGIGLNRSSGSSEVEYFVGAGVIVRSVIVHAGRHYARTPSLGGGFAPGQIVASGVDLPVAFSYHPAWALAVSYRIPLP